MEQILRITSRMFLVVVSFLVLPGIAIAQDGEAAADHPLAFFEPFMGPWVPHPDWEPLQVDPVLLELVPLNFEWVPGGGGIRFCEGITTLGEHDACGLVVWNAVSEQAEFRTFQEHGALVFDGHYEMVDANTMWRVYDVIYPGGEVRKYRESFTLESPDMIVWKTELHRDGVWEHRPDGFRAVRPADAGLAAGSDRLGLFEPLIGEWSIDPESPSETRSAGGHSHPAPDPRLFLEWGGDRGWIELAERRADAAGSVRAAGLIAWNTARQRFTYREHGSDGSVREGVIVPIDESTFEWHYTAYSPEGSAQRWRVRWHGAADASDCFERTTVRIDRGLESTETSDRLCRR